MSFLDDALGVFTGGKWDILGNITGNSSMTDFLADSPLGGFLGLSQNKEAKRQFDESMAWNKYMFNNAHQAEVADLEKAGINPILTATGGSGATAGTPSPTAHMNDGSGVLSFITNLLSGVAGMKNANSNKVSADAASRNADANLISANAQATKATAEANLFDLQKRILGYSEAGAKYKGENYQKFLDAELSKSPRYVTESIVAGINDIIDKLSKESPTSSSMSGLGAKVSEAESSANQPMLLDKPLDFMETHGIGFMPGTKGMKKKQVIAVRNMLHLFKFVYDLSEKL